MSKGCQLRTRAPSHSAHPCGAGTARALRSPPRPGSMGALLPRRHRQPAPGSAEGVRPGRSSCECAGLARAATVSARAKPGPPAPDASGSTSSVCQLPPGTAARLRRAAGTAPRAGPGRACRSSLAARQRHPLGNGSAGGGAGTLRRGQEWRELPVAPARLYGAGLQHARDKCGGAPCAGRVGGVFLVCLVFCFLFVCFVLPFFIGGVVVGFVLVG